jgi:hypothetical protein
MTAAEAVDLVCMCTQQQATNCFSFCCNAVAHLHMNLIWLSLQPLQRLPNSMPLGFSRASHLPLCHLCCCVAVGP